MDTSEENANQFIDSLEKAYLDAIADLNTPSKLRLQSHIDNLSTVLIELDSIYIQFVPNGFLKLRPNVSFEAAEFARIGYSIGLLIRVLQAALKC
jgi:hypothetical protein